MPIVEEMNVISNIICAVMFKLKVIFLEVAELPNNL